MLRDILRQQDDDASGMAGRSGDIPGPESIKRAAAGPQKRKAPPNFGQPIPFKRPELDPYGSVAGSGDVSGDITRKRNNNKRN